MFHTSCNSNSTTTQLQIYTVNPVILNTIIEDYYKVICHEMSFMGMQEGHICIQDSEIRSVSDMLTHHDFQVQTVGSLHSDVVCLLCVRTCPV